MSWTDRFAREAILKLRDDFKINTMLETGTYKGVNAELYAQHFDHVLTVDIHDEYLNVASKRLEKYKNVEIWKMNSWELIERFIENYTRMGRDDTVLFYLDAHFFDPSLFGEDRWVILKELRALKNFDNCVVCIDDFDCENMGHLRYGGEELNWNLIKEYVNPKLFVYSNTRKWCDIYNENTIQELPITVDWHVLDTLQYANSSDEKKYRGRIYFVPRELDLINYNLKKYANEK